MAGAARLSARRDAAQAHAAILALLWKRPYAK
jgi:hypothetical protein